MRREEIARQRQIFGRDAQPPVMARMERGADIVEVRHGGNIDPGTRHRHHHIGKSKTERLQQHDGLIRLRNILPDQILVNGHSRERHRINLRGIHQDPVTPEC